jgi:hypothetical protein
MNLAAGDPHPQYQKESELGIAGGYCGLPNPLNPGLPLRADGAPARPTYPHFETDFLSTGFTATSPWASSSVGTAGTIISATTGTADSDHPGAPRFKSGSNANSGIKVVTDSAALLLAGGEETSLVFMILSASPNTITIRFAFIDTTTVADCANGIYAEIIGGNGAPFVLSGKTAQASARSTTATTINLTEDTWYRLTISLNQIATIATFTLYNMAGATLWSDTLNTNIPTSPGDDTGHGIVATIAGTTTFPMMRLDLMSLDIQRTLVR